MHTHARAHTPTYTLTHSWQIVNYITANRLGLGRQETDGSCLCMGAALIQRILPCENVADFLFSSSKAGILEFYGKLYNIKTLD